MKLYNDGITLEQAMNFFRLKDKNDNYINPYIDTHNLTARLGPHGVVEIIQDQDQPIADPETSKRWLLFKTLGNAPIDQRYVLIDPDTRTVKPVYKQYMPVIDHYEVTKNGAEE